jgi:hypothetical protein
MEPLIGRVFEVNTVEEIAWGVWGLLSFVALIVWLRWEGSREDQKKPGDQKKDEPPEEPKDQAEND